MVREHLQFLYAHSWAILQLSKNEVIFLVRMSLLKTLLDWEADGKRGRKNFHY